MLFVFLAEQYHGIYYLSFQVDVQEHGIHLWNKNIKCT